MNYLHYVGIDVSKETLDVTLVNQKGIMEKQTVIGNTRGSLKKLLKDWRKKDPLILEQTLLGTDRALFEYYGSSFVRIQPIGVGG